MDSSHLEHDGTGLDYCNPTFGVTLTITLTGFSRLLGERHVRENSDPDLTTTFDMTGHRDTGCFDLSVGDPLGFNSHETELAESEIISAMSDTVPRTSLPLSI